MSLPAWIKKLLWTNEERRWRRRRKRPRDVDVELFVTRLEDRRLLSVTAGVDLPLVEQLDTEIVDDNADAANQIVFIDSAVNGHEELAASVDGAEVCLIGSSTDGVEQISNVLSDREGIDAVHILSHGSAGSLTLGTSSLSVDTLGGYSEQIAGWESAFTEDADILLYGCNVGAGAVGTQLLEEFARLTGGDTAASTDATGTTESRGDWILEKTIGPVDASLPLDDHVLADFEGLLPSVSEIDVQGNSQSVADGDTTPSPSDHTDFGSVNVTSDTVTRTFTIQNAGGETLNLTGGTPVTISGTHAGDFSVTQPSMLAIAPFGSTTFQVEFDPSAAGSRTATVNIANDDADENPYDFAIEGRGNQSPTDIGLSDNSVAENQPAGTVVGTFSTTDPDAGDSHTYSFVAGTGDDDNTSFTIVGDQLKTADVFDYEAQNSYSIRVQTDDGNGGTYDEQFTISVADVAETLSIGVSDWPADNALTLVRSGDSVYFDSSGGQVGQSHAFASLNDITVEGASDVANTLTIDVSGGNPIPNGGAHFDGGGGTGNDKIIVQGSNSAMEISYDGTDAEAGTIVVDGQTVTYEEVEPNTIDITGTTDLTIEFANGDTGIEFTAVDSHTTRVAGNSFATTTFDNPSDSLTVNFTDTNNYTVTFTDLADTFEPTNGIDINGNASGGNVSLTIVDLGDAFGHSTTGVLDIDLAGGTDSVAFQTNAQSLASLAVTAETISQSAELIVSGITSLDAGAGTITLTDPDNDFTGAVSLSNTGANNIAVTDKNALLLGTVSMTPTTAGQLSLTSVGISQDGATTITTGTGPVTINAGAGAIALGNSNDFNGTVAMSTSQDNSATVNDTDDLTLGASTLGGTLSATAAGLTVSGAVTTGNTTAGTNSLSAGTGQFTNTATIDVGTGGSLDITADTVDIQNTITGNGGITLQPSTGSRTIGLNDSTGDFNLTATELRYLASTGTVTIGASGGSGTVNIGSSGEVDVSGGGFDLTIRGGSTEFNGSLTLRNDGVLEISSGGAITSAAAGTDVIGKTLSFTAGSGGVGTSTNPLRTDVTNVYGTTSGNSDIYLVEVDNVTIPATLSAGSGTIGLLGGTFQLGGAKLGNSSTILIDGGTLNVKNYHDTVGGVTLTSGSLSGTTGSLSSMSDIAGNPGVGDTFHVTGRLWGTAGVGLNMTGDGTLKFDNAYGGNLYNGATTVSSGMVQLARDNQLHNDSSVNVNGGMLDIGSYSDTVAGVTLTDGSITGSGGKLTSTSTFAVKKGSVGAILAGTVGLDKTTGDTVTLSGANEYAGATQVTAGTLKLGAADVLPNTTDMTGSGTLDLNAFDETIDALGGTLTVTNTGGSNAKLTMGASDGGDTFSGTIEDGATKTVSLKKIGAGIQTLSSANTYTGATEVSAGTLVIKDATALGAAAGTTSVGASATLQVNADGLAIAEPLDTLEGTLQNSGGDNEWSGAITLASEIEVDANRTFTVSGKVSGSGLTKTGDGTLVLSNTANDYSGATDIQAGTLSLGHAGVIPDTSDVTVSGELDLNGKAETINSLGGAGSVTAAQWVPSH